MQWIRLSCLSWEDVFMYLTCSPSVSGWRSNLAYTHSRSPLLYIKALRPPPALPVRSPLCRYHLWRTSQTLILSCCDLLETVWWRISVMIDWHTYRLPSSEVDTQRILRRSLLGRNNCLRLLFWPRRTSTFGDITNNSVNAYYLFCFIRNVNKWAKSVSRCDLHWYVL